MTLLKQRSVQITLLLLALAATLTFLRDLNPTTIDLSFGIEFKGGLRIPVSLERSVTPSEMEVVVETLKSRLNKYGLAQFVVRPLGDREVIVELPVATIDVLRSVEKILREQGKFEALINGRVALVGEDIMPGAVGGPHGEIITEEEGRLKWELLFTTTRAGAERFSKAAFGKANYPVYMFLDRPSNAVLILSRAELNATTTNLPIAQQVMSEALRKEGDDIKLLFAEELNESNLGDVIGNSSVAILSEGAARVELLNAFRALGFENATGVKRLFVKRSEEALPSFYAPTLGEVGIAQWGAIGLLSAPILSPGLAGGQVTQFYSISGPAEGATRAEQRENAVRELRELKSILSGGRLPVSAFIGSAYAIAPSLGEAFLQWSVVATIAAILVVAALVAFRYRRAVLAIPIIATNLAEIFILAAVLGGLGTIELSAMAGIIALIGTAVDDQLIVIDEMLRRRVAEEREIKERIARAFEVVLTIASIAFLAMVPLLLSGIVEITGFALATILGVAIGALVTRPAFGALVSELSRRGVL